MLTFEEHLDQDRFNELNEALITFGGRAYPKFNNIVIMAGGAGSGKGFVQSTLIGMEGRVFDVDALKSLGLRASKLKTRIKRELGVDTQNLNLKNPSDVSKLHAIMSDMGIAKRREMALFNTILTADPGRKPNLIFDVTLKDLQKLAKITSNVTDLGYKKEDIHIVWVVNDIEIAQKQNKERDRMVAPEILINTHRGVSSTMNDIVKMGSKLKNYMDGDIVFAFNKIGVDSSVLKSKRGGMVIDKANYVYVKRRGKPVSSIKSLSKSLKDKINSYVPKGVEW
jgi:hypothetical protein